VLVARKKFVDIVEARHLTVLPVFLLFTVLANSLPELIFAARVLLRVPRRRKCIHNLRIKRAQPFANCLVCRGVLVQAPRVIFEGAYAGFELVGLPCGSNRQFHSRSRLHKQPSNFQGGILWPLRCKLTYAGACRTAGAPLQARGDKSAVDRRPNSFDRTHGNADLAHNQVNSKIYML
jgi:hypothetical protein